jgi:hypothetical protein
MLVRSIGSVACFAVANDIHVVVRVHPRVRTSQPIFPVLAPGCNLQPRKCLPTGNADGRIGSEHFFEKNY